MRVPERMVTARYAAIEALRAKASADGIVPVRVGMPPVVPVPYALNEIAISLVPTRETLAAGGGEWRPLCYAYRRQLNEAGAEKIEDELAGIGARHPGKRLVLVSEDDLEKGHRDPRIVAAAWIEEKLGSAVLELTADGRELRVEDLPKRVRPKRPRQHDARWTHGSEPVRPWPLSDDDLRAWVAARHWQFARTSPTNPHQYSHRLWGCESMFSRVVAYIREHGRQEEYAGDVYTVYDLDDKFYWSMGDPISVTIILNSKYHDSEKQARLAEERTGKSREELGLEIPRPPEAREDRDQAAPGLFDGQESA